MEDKIIKRINKLLSLAGNNPSKEEAEQAMMKAQELMAKHNLSKKDITIDEEIKPIKFQCDQDTKTVTWWFHSLATIIAKNFRCIAYKTTSRYRASKMILIGEPEDVEIANTILIHAVKSLRDTSKYFMEIWSLCNEGKDKRGVKNDFIRGFLLGLKDKFRENVTCKDLIIVIPNAVIKSANAMGFRRSKTKTHTGGDPSANNAGYKQGKNFNSSGEKRLV